MVPLQLHSRDPKYGQAAQCDKQDFQTLIRDLDLVAVHCQHQWQPTFKHGDHSSRIDFMFVRRSLSPVDQISCLGTDSVRTNCWKQCTCAPFPGHVLI